MAERAQVDIHPPDCAGARDLLSRAQAHLTTAGLEGADAASSYILMYEAARAALDAVLRAAGRRVTSGLGAHQEYLKEAKRQLGQEHAQLLARVDATRQIRHDVSYRSRRVSATELDGVRAAARDTVAVAEAKVTDLCS